MDKHTEGPWFVSGVRFRMNGREWHSVNRYDEELKQYENIALVGFDPRTGEGLSDARLIAAAPELLGALVFMSGRFNAQMDESDRTAINSAISKATGKQQ